MNVIVQLAAQTPPENTPPSPDDFRRWANAAVNDDAEVCVRIVGDEEAAALNHRYRGCPQPTNVLSFPFASPAQQQENYLGDVVLAASVVAREAREQGKPLQNHWAHLFIHGLLHLKGYRHDSERNAGRMEAREVEIMRALDLPDPYEA